MGIPDTIGEYSPTAFLTWYERAYIDAVYTDGEGNIAAHVRKAAGDEDISGDYNDYSETSAQEIGGHSVTVKGEVITTHFVPGPCAAPGFLKTEETAAGKPS